MVLRSLIRVLLAPFSFITYRVYRIWRATKSRIHSRPSPATSLVSLETSWSPLYTLRSLRSHLWSIYDAQYLFLAIVAIFGLSVSEAPGLFVSSLVAALLIAGLFTPITGQFLLPLLPTLTYLLLFSSCKYVNFLFLHSNA
jgi:hypothetical protein